MGWLKVFQEWPDDENMLWSLMLIKIWDEIDVFLKIILTKTDSGREEENYIHGTMIKNLSTRKAAGQDRFTRVFYKHLWNR